METVQFYSGNWAGTKVKHLNDTVGVTMLVFYRPYNIVLNIFSTHRIIYVFHVFMLGHSEPSCLKESVINGIFIPVSFLIN